MDNCETRRCGFCAEEVEPIKTISRDQMLAEYREMFGVSFPQAVLDADFSFETITSLRCRRCRTISYVPQVLGDGAYYNYLSRTLSWYYDKNRWEYPLVLDFLKAEKIGTCLEVGCGRGHFLHLMREAGLEGHGYEIEPDSIHSLRSQGFKILTELNESLGTYDCILIFQVLEHLPDPFGFLKMMASNLRRGGSLLISTPTTPSCTAFSDNVFLYPPHHQWLPTPEGFRKLAGRLDLTCEGMQFEPSSKLQVEYGLRKRYELTFGMKRWLGRLPAAGRLAALTLKTARLLRFDWTEVGHTILVRLRKQ